MEQLTKTRFQNLVVNHHLRLGDNLFDPLDPYVLRVNGNTYVKGDISFIGDFVVDGNVNIKKDVVIDGSLTVLGKTTSIMSENKIIGDNTLIINANLNDLDTDYIRESGIVILRPKKDGIHQEPFKIVYKDVTIGDIDHNNILDIGISGDLHRVATINDYPTNRGVPAWDETNQILDTATNIYVEKHSIGGESNPYWQNVHVRNGTIYNTGRDGQHYDIDILYQPPPKFVFDSSNSTTVTFTVNWRKEHIIKRFAFINDDAPFINNVAVDIQQISPENKTTGWINATITHPKDALSYTFRFSRKTPITNGNETLFIDSDSSYNVRIYGINYVEQTEDNYLYIDNLFLKPAGVPLPPTNIQFISSTLDNITFKFNAPSDNDILTEEIEDIPLIIEYEYIYVPIDTGTTRYPTHAHNELTYTKVYEPLEAEQNLNHQITIPIQNNLNTPIYVGTAYQLSSLKAKNEVNRNFSENGVNTEITVVTPVPNDNIYYITPSINTSIINETQKTFYNPSKNSVLTISYYNVNDVFSVTEEISSFFVNSGRLGKNAANQELAYAKSYYNLDTDVTGQTGIYTLDTTVTYKGYYNQTTDGDYSISPTTYAGFENVACIDAKNTDYDTTYSGFGLYGTYKIKPSGIGTGFPASQNIYGIRYTIENKGSLNNITQVGNEIQEQISYMHLFVVDDLNTAPTISDVINTTEITSVIYSHGIPSVQIMTVNISYNVNHIGSQFLPENKIVSVISKLTRIQGITDTNITTETISASKQLYVEKTFPNCFIASNILTEIVEDVAISEAFTIKPINLLYPNETETIISLKENNESTNKFWFDVKSFSSSSNKITSIKSVASTTYIYQPTNKYNFVSYSNQKNEIAENQLLYINGGFTNNPIYYKDYSTGYIKKIGETYPNYSGFVNTGDTYNGQTYKWVVKKITSSSNAGSTQYKKLSITLNDTTYTLNNIHTMPENIKIFTIQKYTNGNRYTEWLDSREEFTSDIATLNVEHAGNLTSVGGIYYLVFKDLVNTTFDFYVRIGIPIGGVNYSISNIIFENR